jgi:hypothetical protein
MDRSRRAAPIMMVLAALLAAGCQETTRSTGFGTRPLPPKPRAARPTPADARTDAVVLNVSAAPLDSNGNGHPDLILATVHLFDQRYPPPLHEEGVLIFELCRPGEAGMPGRSPLRVWRIDAEAMGAMRSRSVFGPCYQMRLSLLEDGGTDLLPVTGADILTRFEPADGRAAVHASDINHVQLGPNVNVPRYEERDLLPSESGGASP